jgi:hypothetical protein
MSKRLIEIPFGDIKLRKLAERDPRFSHPGGKYNGQQFGPRDFTKTGSRECVIQTGEHTGWVCGNVDLTWLVLIEVEVG